MNINYITFGIIIDDIVTPNGSTHMGVLGGGGVQTAWGMAAALGTGEPVGLVAGIGADLDDHLLEPLRAAGINLEGLRLTKHPTPRAWQVTEKDGRRTQVWRTPTAILGEQMAKNWEVLPSSYQEAHYFHWGIHVEDDPPPFAHYLHSIGRCVSLEPFRAPEKPLISVDRAAVYRTCDVFSATEREFAAMINSSSTLEAEVGKFAQMGGQYLVLRQGERGATVFDCSTHQRWHAPAFPSQVVDTIGAGNCFCGAFLARLADGCETALCHGIVAASYMIEQIGLPPRLPDPHDYQQRLETIRQQIKVVG